MRSHTTREFEIGVCVCECVCKCEIFFVFTFLLFLRLLLLFRVLFRSEKSVTCVYNYAIIIYELSLNYIHLTLPLENYSLVKNDDDA